MKAFPHDGGLGNEGMDLRTYLAGQALAGFTANPEIVQVVELRSTLSGQDPTKVYSRMAIEAADALLAELGKEKP